MQAWSALAVLARALRSDLRLANVGCLTCEDRFFVFEMWWECWAVRHGMEGKKSPWLWEFLLGLQCYCTLLFLFSEVLSIGPAIFRPNFFIGIFGLMIWRQYRYTHDWTLSGIVSTSSISNSSDNTVSLSHSVVPSRPWIAVTIAATSVWANGSCILLVTAILWS